MSSESEGPGSGPEGERPVVGSLNLVPFESETFLGDYSKSLKTHPSDTPNLRSFGDLDKPLTGDSCTGLVLFVLEILIWETRRLPVAEESSLVVEDGEGILCSTQDRGHLRSSLVEENKLHFTLDPKKTKKRDTNQTSSLRFVAGSSEAQVTPYEHSLGAGADWGHEEV